MKLALAAFFFAVGLLAVIFIADLGWISPSDVLRFKDGDKVLHFGLLGTLALLVDLAVLQAAKPGNAVRMALLGSVVITVLSSAEEFSQIWMPSRTPDWYDLLASCAGIV